MKSLFLAKIKNSNERDVVYYINFKGFECNHYFGGMSLGGACFSGFGKEFREIIENDFDNISSVLSKKDFEKLFELHDNIKELGYGIEYGSEKYYVGIKILEEYKNTIEKKLLSEDNKKLFKEIEEEEKQYCMEEYNLTYDEITEVFNNYGKGYHDLGYRDRGIIGLVYDDFDNMVYEEKWSFGYENIPYFDDNAFGNDLLENDTLLELESGKIVSYNY